MNDNMRRQIMGARGAVSAQPVEDEDARHEQNVTQAVDAALMLLYDEAAHDDVMAMIPEGDEMGGVSLVAGELIQQVDEKSGGNMPDDVILPAAVEIMNDIIDFLGEKGNKEFTDEEHGRSLQLLMQKLATDYGTTPEQMREAMASIPQEMQDEAVARYGDPNTPQQSPMGAQ